MAEVLPITFKDDSSGEIRTKLEGVERLFFLAWNTRNSYWTISLYKADGTRVWQGLRVTIGVRINRQIVDPNDIPGYVTAVDTTGGRQPPGREDLYTGKVKLVYVTAAEAAERDAANAA